MSARRTHPLKVAIASDGRHNYEIAAAASINPSLLASIISGRSRATEPVMARLAGVLGREVAELFPDALTADSVAAERAAQGLPATVADPHALARVDAALGARGHEGEPDEAA